jgi:hypothetical protein
MRSRHNTATSPTSRGRGYARLLATLERIEHRVTSRAFERVEGPYVLFLAGFAQTLEDWTIRYMTQSASTTRHRRARAVRP